MNIEMDEDTWESRDSRDSRTKLFQYNKLTKILEKYKFFRKHFIIPMILPNLVIVFVFWGITFSSSIAYIIAGSCVIFLISIIFLYTREAINLNRLRRFFLSLPHEISYQYQWRTWFIQGKDIYWPTRMNSRDIQSLKRIEEMQIEFEEKYPFDPVSDAISKKAMEDYELDRKLERLSRVSRFKKEFKWYHHSKFRKDMDLLLPFLESKGIDLNRDVSFSDLKKGINHEIKITIENRPCKDIIDIFEKHGWELYLGMDFYLTGVEK